MKKAIITIILMILVVVITAIFIFCIKEKDVSLLNLQGEIIMPSQYFDPDKRGIMYINTDNATVEFDPNIDIAYSFGEKDVFYYATS